MISHLVVGEARRGFRERCSWHSIRRQAGRNPPPKGGLRGHAGRALSGSKTRARDIVMAKSTKPSRGRRPIGKAAIAAPRVVAKRAAASIRPAHSPSPPPYRSPRPGNGRVGAGERREGGV